MRHDNTVKAISAPSPVVPAAESSSRGQEGSEATVEAPPALSPAAALEELFPTKKASGKAPAVSPSTQVAVSSSHGQQRMSSIPNELFGPLLSKMSTASVV